ncbi:hypothetical protein GC197_03300 [bacterium]|nr:hypothetical protein [bacterium]
MKLLATIPILLTFFAPPAEVPLDRAPAQAQAAAMLAYAALSPTQHLLPRDPKPQPPNNSISTYEDAYQQFQTDRRSMAVMLTADWCPNCPPVKTKLTRMKEQGSLPEMSVAIVNVDQNPALAKEIARTAGKLSGKDRYGVPLVALFTWRDGKQTVRAVTNVDSLTRRK